MKSGCKHVAHLTSVHPRKDVRIFVKECCTLVDSGLCVSLIVADGGGSQTLAGVKVISVPRARSRLLRFIFTPLSILFMAFRLRADVYHLHDPELAFIGLVLKLFGQRVIFDAHENFPKQILTKSYLPKPVLQFISIGWTLIERAFFRFFDAIVCATPEIYDKFVKINSVCCLVQNFPSIKDVVDEHSEYFQANGICYVGGVGRIRGFHNVLQAVRISRSKPSFHVCGPIFDDDLNLEIPRSESFPEVCYYGNIERPDVFSLMRKSKIGMVVLHPTPNYIQSYPIKMFEYMAAGIPVIASDFPLWKNIISANKCGICINPLNENEIAAAIDMIYADPELAACMGINGKEAIRKKYNWENESKHLINLYTELLGLY